MRTQSPGWGDPPEECMETHSCQYSCLKNPHEQSSLAGYSPQGPRESDMTEKTEKKKKQAAAEVKKPWERGTTQEPIFGHQSFEVPIEYSNDHVDQAAELWSIDKNLGIINMNSWLLRGTWTGVYTGKKPWGTK